jgi:acetyl-CoA C-acetyltransferase
LIDYEITSVDFHKEGLLMAPALAVPRLLSRHNLRYEDIELWEIHEAFSAQVEAHIKAWENQWFIDLHVSGAPVMGPFPRFRVNPNGGSLAIGHPFAATGARILSQAIKELAACPSGTKAIVSICADGGVGTVALMEAA